MKTRYIIGHRQVLPDDQKEILLTYFLIKETHENGPLYGIEITKQPVHAKELSSSEYTGPISRDAFLVRGLAEKLCLGTVTPITLLEHVDELMEAFA